MPPEKQITMPESEALKHNRQLVTNQIFEIVKILSDEPHARSTFPLSENEWQKELLELAITHNTGNNQDKIFKLFEGELGKRGKRGPQGIPGPSTKEAGEFAEQAVDAKDDAEAAGDKAISGADAAGLSAIQAETAVRNAKRILEEIKKSEEKTIENVALSDATLKGAQAAAIEAKEAVKHAEEIGENLGKMVESEVKKEEQKEVSNSQEPKLKVREKTYHDYIVEHLNKHPVKVFPETPNQQKTYMDYMIKNTNFGKGEKGDLLDRMWKEGQLKKYGENKKEIKPINEETKTIKTKTVQQPEVKTVPSTEAKSTISESAVVPEKPSKPKTKAELEQELEKVIKEAQRKAQEIAQQIAQMEQAEGKPVVLKEKADDAVKAEEPKVKAETEIKTDKDNPEAKELAEKAEKKRKYEEECRLQLEAAERKGEQKGREKLLAEIEEKKNKNIFRRGFRKVKEFVKKHKKVIIAGAVGAAAMLTTWGISQAVGHFLPLIPINLNDVFIKAGEIFIR